MRMIIRYAATGDLVIIRGHCVQQNKSTVLMGSNCGCTVDYTGFVRVSLNVYHWLPH